MKKKWRIVKFGDVLVSKTFRYKEEWCQKLAPLAYLDGHAHRHPAPKFSTLVVVLAEDCA